MCGPEKIANKFQVVTLGIGRHLAHSDRAVRYHGWSQLLDLEDRFAPALVISAISANLGAFCD